MAPGTSFTPDNITGVICVAHTIDVFAPYANTIYVGIREFPAVLILHLRHTVKTGFFSIDCALIIQQA